ASKSWLTSTHRLPMLVSSPPRERRIEVPLRIHRHSPMRVDLLPHREQVRLHAVADVGGRVERPRFARRVHACGSQFVGTTPLFTSRLRAGHAADLCWAISLMRTTAASHAARFASVTALGAPSKRRHVFGLTPASAAAAVCE